MKRTMGLRGLYHFSKKEGKMDVFGFEGLLTGLWSWELIDYPEEKDSHFSSGVKWLTLQLRYENYLSWCKISSHIRRMEEKTFLMLLLFMMTERRLTHIRLPHHLISDSYDTDPVLYLNSVVEYSWTQMWRHICSLKRKKFRSKLPRREAQ